MKRINIKCTGSGTLTIEEMTDFQGKLKTISKGNLKKLKKSILTQGFIAPIFIWEHLKKKHILDGHSRLKVLVDLKKENYLIPKIPIVNIEAETKKEAKYKLLAITNSYGQLNLEGVSLFIKDISISKLKEIVFMDKQIGILENREARSGKKFIIKNSSFEISEEIKKIIAENNKVYLSFSGGKDSAMVLYLMRQHIPVGKGEVLHVDTGAEMPCLMRYMVQTCKTLQYPLKVIRSKDHIIEYYLKKGRYPSAQFKDCIFKFIANPLESYMKRRKENIIIIRGGRLKQSSHRSVLMSEGEVRKVRGKTTLLSPLYLMSKEKYEEYEKEVIEKIGIWEGYSKGFKRTACWFCPFQVLDQYKALKKHYPMLYNELLQLDNSLYGEDTYSIKHFKKKGLLESV